MSVSSSSSSLAAINDREAKKLEKVLLKEAKAEQKSIDHALKDVKQAEKTLRKCTKTTEKAQKSAIKVKDKEHATAKALNKAKHKHADALEKEVRAQDILSSKRECEVETCRSVRQMQTDLEDCQQTMQANAQDRETRLAGIRAQFK